MISINGLYFLCFLLLHAILYIFNAVIHRCFRRNQRQFSLGRLYENLLLLMGTSSLYYLGGGYDSIFDAQPTVWIIEFYVPCMIWVIISFTFCEVNFVNNSLSDIKSWNWKSYIIYGLLSLVFLALFIMNAMLPELILNVMISLIPCVVYYGLGYILYLLDRSENVQYNITYSSILFFLCLIAKTNHLYSRLLGSFTTGCYIVFFSVDGWSELISYESVFTQDHPLQSSQIKDFRKCSDPERSPSTSLYKNSETLDNSQESQDLSLISEDMNNLEYSANAPLDPDLNINISAIENTLYNKV